jgi:hypothetical protein
VLHLVHAVCLDHGLLVLRQCTWQSIVNLASYRSEDDTSWAYRSCLSR